MNLTRRRRLFVTLLAGAWLPVVVSCQPGGFDALIRVISDDWSCEEVIVEEVYEPCYYDCWDCHDDWGYQYYVDFYYDD